LGGGDVVGVVGDEAKEEGAILSEVARRELVDQLPLVQPVPRTQPLPKEQMVPHELGPVREHDEPEDPDKEADDAGNEDEDRSLCLL
ncbi:hypothetical protein ACDT12_13745, partial [Staphylococcus aureus]